MEAQTYLKVVLVHDWLTGMRGGEKCLEYFCRRWPEAPLYTLIYQRGSTNAIIEDRPIRTSFLQWFPNVHRYYRYLLPLMPKAVNWTMPECDLVLSSSHCVAKSVTPPQGVSHICYCFTPMRYAWHLRESYFGSGKKTLKDRLRDKLLASIRQWDQETAARVTHFVAISKTVQQRIRECYGRDSKVIYPPVNTDFYHPAAIKREDYYLVISAFAPYKRIDLAIQACNQLRKQLVLIGQGQQENYLRSLAGPTIHFLGWQPDEVIRDHLRRCRALLFPGEEDFGIVPVEAQACGAPVIAYGRGGATETVLTAHLCAEPTGLWYDEQSDEALIEAIHDFETVQSQFDAAAIRRQAERFGGNRFASEIFTFIDEVLQEKSRFARRAA